MKEEPQIIYYYQTLPEYAIVIENLNNEYNELITNYIQLSDRINPYISPKQKNDNLFFLFLIIIIFESSFILFILV